jgi:hypothetical protein
LAFRVGWGVITIENILEYLMMEEAIAKMN